MASIYKDILVDAPAEDVWAAVRDVGGEAKLAPSFVTASKVEGDVREITFANGRQARERIIDVDDARRRIAYAVIESQMTHHSASMQVVPEGPERCRVIWIADLLPNELATLVGPMMQAGLDGLKAAREREPAAA
jgi:hypothetical protein